MSTTQNAASGLATGMTAVELAAVRALVSGPGIPWASRPSAAANADAMIVLNDIPAGGRSMFVSNGTNWRPVGGSVLLAAMSGSLAIPVAVGPIAGGAALLALPGGAIKIPAGLLVARQSILQISAQWRKVGVAAGVPCGIWMGTTNGFSDQKITGIFIGTGNHYPMNFEVSFGSATSMTALSIPGTNVTGTNVPTEAGTNINISNDMWLNFGFDSSTAPDSIDLIRLSVRLFQ